MPARATGRRHRTSRLHERRRKGSRGGGSRSGSCNLCKWHVWAGALFVAVCFLFVTQVRIVTTSATATGVEDVSGARQHDHLVVNKPVHDRIGTVITAQPAGKVHGPAPVPVKHFGVGPGKEIVDGGPGQKMSGVKKRGKTVFGRYSAGRTKTAGIPTDEGLGQSEESSAATDGTGQSLSDSVEGRGGEGGGRGRGGGLKGSKAAGPVAGGNYRDPADGVEMEFAVGREGKGPLETFLAAGKKLPVVLMTCNREALLRKTIESLRNVRGMDMSTVMVLQDGSDEPVAEFVRKQGLYLHQNTKTPGLRGGGRAGDGAARIAAHYKFALEHVFGKAPEAPAVIIVEDDLLFSPDFLEYLEANAPVLERDPTTLVLSAWNDNGYRERVWDKTELQRTLFFPGLGWLLTRRLYEEIKPHWPAQHWDHWLRDERQHKGRECVFPEVPRTYHNGIKGTFMDQNMHDKLFKNIDFNTDASFKWPLPTDRPATEPPPYAKAVKVNYERRVEARIAGAQHVNTLEDLAAAADRQQDVVLWYSLEQTEEQSDRWGHGSGPPFKPLSDFFGIWHEYKRASHEGMHTFRYYGHPRIMLINAAKSPYAKLKPAELISATMDTLHGNLRGAGDGGLGLDLQVVAGDRPSVSCDEVCSAKGMTCRESRFELINSCKLLVDNFPCDTCAESYGPDQPSYVELDAPKLNYPGQCLVTSKPAESRCSALHELTRRLCPCHPRSR